MNKQSWTKEKLMPPDGDVSRNLPEFQSSEFAAGAKGGHVKPSNGHVVMWPWNVSYQYNNWQPWTGDCYCINNCGVNNRLFDFWIAIGQILTIHLQRFPMDERCVYLTAVSSCFTTRKDATVKHENAIYQASFWNRGRCMSPKILTLLSFDRICIINFIDQVKWSYRCW